MIDAIILILHLAIGWILLWMSTVDLGIIHKNFITVTARISAAAWWVLDIYHIKEAKDNDIDLMLSELFLLILVILVSLAQRNIIKLIKSCTTSEKHLQNG